MSHGQLFTCLMIRSRRCWSAPSEPRINTHTHQASSLLCLLLWITVSFISITHFLLLIINNDIMLISGIFFLGCRIGSSGVSGAEVSSRSVSSCVVLMFWVYSHELVSDMLVLFWFRQLDLFTAHPESEPQSGFYSAVCASSCLRSAPRLPSRQFAVEMLLRREADTSGPTEHRTNF